MLWIDPANCETVSVMSSGAPIKAKSEQRKGEGARGRRGRGKVKKGKGEKEEGTDSWTAIHSLQST